MSFNIVKNDKKSVIIVGGGFGGLKLANKLKKSGFQVVLVDKNNYHQFPPLTLYSLAECFPAISVPSYAYSPEAGVDERKV